MEIQRAVETMKILKISNLNVWFGEKRILSDISHEFEENTVTGIIGPSGGGKTSVLRSINRMNDSIGIYRIEGKIEFNEKDIYRKDIPVHHLRRQVGMIFQKPCVFPKSIYGNMIFGLKNLKIKNKSEFPRIVEDTLKSAHLWDEVKDRLSEKAQTLSMGQQQRLCIARALTVEPTVLMMDEPTSSLDPKSTKAIEKLIAELKEKLTLIVVTHNVEQAKRISDEVIFLFDGKIIEEGKKEEIFNNPKKDETREYLKWARSSVSESKK